MGTVKDSEPTDASPPAGLDTDVGGVAARTGAEVSGRTGGIGAPGEIGAPTGLAARRAGVGPGLTATESGAVTTGPPPDRSLRPPPE